MYALPLDSTRILPPRISRGRDAEYPRGINVPWPERWPFHDHGQVANSPRTRFVRVREQSMSANSPRTQARSQPGRIREHVHASNSPRTGISRGHKLSANFPHSRTVHVFILAALSDALRPDTGQRTDLSPWPCVRGPGAEVLHAHLHYSCPCPPLIQPQSAKRSRNLHPAVRRNSTTCFWRRISSQSCDRNGHLTGLSPSCSRSIACPRAQQLSPCSATRCLEKTSGHAAGLVENEPLVHRMANPPLLRRNQTSPVHCRNLP